MNIAIVGFGSQGASALKYWNKPENSITVCDSNESVELPEGINSNLGKDYLKNLNDFDLIVRSPVVHPRILVENNGPQILSKVTSNTNEFMKVCPTSNIIGVTGTKGKGTTSTIIYNLLKEAGHNVHIGGNIGTPPLEMLNQGIKSEDWVILELANFQLIDLKISPKIAVCLLVEPEHQDWHPDMAEYAGAKKQLFAHQKTEDTAIFYAKNDLSKEIASVSPGKLVPYFEKPGAVVEDGFIVIDSHKICHVDEIRLPGKHNWQNICAAITAVWPIINDVEPIRKVLKTLGSLPFRIELRGEINGVKFYNDSFATAPAATIAAINSVKMPKVMIIGGHDRGLELDNLSKKIADKQSGVKKVILIGQSAKRTAESFEKYGFTNYEITDAKSMDEIVKIAYSGATADEAVVLSPSFASFDMFKNFEVRGNAFNDAVKELK